jgi:hypothetical protein
MQTAERSRSHTRKRASCYNFLILEEKYLWALKICDLDSKKHARSNNGAAR